MPIKRSIETEKKKKWNLFLFYTEMRRPRWRTINFTIAWKISITNTKNHLHLMRNRRGAIKLHWIIEANYMWITDLETLDEMNGSAPICAHIIQNRRMSWNWRQKTSRSKIDAIRWLIVKQMSKVHTSRWSSLQNERQMIWPIYFLVEYSRIWAEILPF